MKSTPSILLILRNDYWCFYIGLILGLVFPLLSLGSLAVGRTRLSLADAVPVLAIAFVVLRVRRIRDVLVNGRTVEGAVVMSIGSGLGHHLRVRYRWEGKTRVRRWLLNRLVRELEGRVEVCVDPERPHRAYPVAPFVSSTAGKRPAA